MRYEDLDSGIEGIYNWESPTGYMVGAIVTWSLLLLSIIVLMCSCKKVGVAVALIQCGGEFLDDTKDLFCFVLLGKIFRGLKWKKLWGRSSCI
jgi:hypothetical protein